MRGESRPSRRHTDWENDMRDANDIDGAAAGEALLAAARDALHAFGAAWDALTRDGVDMPADYPARMAEMTATATAMLAVDHVADGAAGQDCDGREFAGRYPGALAGIGDGDAGFFESRAACLRDYAGYCLSLADQCDGGETPRVAECGEYVGVGVD